MFAYVWEHIQDEYLREFRYTAECAKLKFELETLYDNVDFEWSGFNHVLPEYIYSTLEKITEMREAELEDAFD